MKTNPTIQRDIRILAIVLLISALFGCVAAVINNGNWTLRTCITGVLMGFFIAALCVAGN